MPHQFRRPRALLRRRIHRHAPHTGRPRETSQSPAPRGGAARADFEEALAVVNEPNPVILEIDDALNRLAKFDERKVRVMELTFFGGLTTAAVADAIAVSEPTAKRELRMARAWIKSQLQSS